MKAYIVAAGIAALFGSSAAQAEYVDATSLNCRAKPQASAPVAARLSRGEAVKVLSTQGTWSQVETRSVNCWVASEYLSAEYVSAPQPLMTSRPAATRSRSTRSNSRSSTAPARSFDGSCPCSGRNVCVGPRGGRYCITSGGNKRYGV